MNEIMQMEAFKALYETQSYTIAAKQLGVSQSYLSKLIKNIETQYGLNLLVRKNGKIFLTNMGLKYYDSCIFILEEFHRIDEELKLSNNGKKDSISIGITRNAIMANFFAPMNKFISSNPNINVNIKEIHPESFKDALDMQDIDVAVGWYRGENSRHYDLYPIISGVWLLCVNAQHPLADRTCVYWSELKDYDIILSSDNNYRQRMILEFQKRGFTPKVKHYATMFYNILEMIDKNLGIAPIPSSLDLNTFKDLRRIPLLPELPCKFYIASRKDDPSPCVASFISFYLNNM